MCIVKAAALADSIAQTDLNDLRTFAACHLSEQPCPGP
jgi:hypothetical protein